ncbi:MAG: cyclic nucleotide-binding domain-containing protein [Gracilimonas sp.]
METTIERVIFLQGIELFEDIPSEQLAHLAGITTLFSADSGQTLFTEDESTHDLYIMIGGVVHLSRNGKIKKKVVEPEAIGPWSFFDGKERLMTANCKQESHFLVISRLDFYDLLEDRVNLARGLISYFVKRIRKLTDTTDAIV